MGTLVRTLGVTLVLSCLPLAAADSSPPPADLEIAGRKVLTLRSTVLGFAPADRAKAAQARLRAAYVKNNRLVLSQRDVAEGTQVLADGRIMLLVTPGDVNTAGGDTPPQVAGDAIEVLRQVVIDLQDRADPGLLARGAGLAAIATLIAILLARFVFALDRRVAEAVTRVLSARIRRVQVSGVEVLDESHTVRLARQAIHGLAWVVVAMLGYLWLNAVLGALPFTRAWGEKLTAAMLDVVGSGGAALLDALPGILVVILIFFAARLATRMAEFFFGRVEERDMRVGWLDRHSAPPTRFLVTLVVWIFAAAMAYPYLPGSDSRAFQGLSVMVGLMISLGAASVVGQAASGLILMYSSAFRVGDYVRISESEGTISQIGIFVTRMRTGMGDSVILPNNHVLGNVTRNYSRGAFEGGFVVTTQVTIGYDTPWRQVEALLVEAARRTPGIGMQPPPRVFEEALSDFYVEYRLAARCEVDDAGGRAVTLSRLNANILDVFNEHGVQIMSPHYRSDTPSPKIVPREEWHKAPAKPERA